MWNPLIFQSWIQLPYCCTIIDIYINKNSTETEFNIEQHSFSRFAKFNWFCKHTDSKAWHISCCPEMKIKSYTIYNILRCAVAFSIFLLLITTKCIATMVCTWTWPTFIRNSKGNVKRVERILGTKCSYIFIQRIVLKATIKYKCFKSV